MGLLSIFKRKPGGTFFGNVLRGVGKAVAGKKLGLGQGKMMISQEDYDRKNGVSTQPLVPGDNSTQMHVIDAAFQAAQSAIPIATEGLTPGSGTSVGQAILNTVGGAVLGTPEGQEAAVTAIWAKAKPFVIAAAVIGGSALTYKALKPKRIGRR